MLYKLIIHKPWYPWLVAALCMLTVIASNGLVNSGITVFDKSLLQEFGWSVGELKTRDAISFIGGAVFVLGTGYLVDKYGAKAFLMAGMALIALGYYFYGQIQNLPQLYMMHIVFGMVIACAGNMASIMMAVTWVGKYRGFAVGMVIAGTSIGGMVIPPLANALNKNLGWRASMQWEALFPLIVMLLVFLLIKNRRPSEAAAAGQDAGQHPGEKAQDKTGMPFAEVLRQSSFYLIALAGALTFFSILALWQHVFLYMDSLGYASDHAALALSLLAFTALAGKILGGLVSDFINPNKLFKFQMLLMLVGVLGVSQFSQWVWFFLALTGFGWGGLHTLYNYILITLFGLRDAGKINSVVSFAEAIGGGFGIYFTGHLFDYFGNYPSALLVSAGCMAVATACVFARAEPAET